MIPGVIEALQHQGSREETWFPQLLFKVREEGESDAKWREDFFPL